MQKIKPYFLEKCSIGIKKTLGPTSQGPYVSHWQEPPERKAMRDEPEFYMKAWDDWWIKTKLF